MTQQNPALPTPIWLEREQLVEAPEPLTLDWLFNQDSLTRRLTCLSADTFSVTPLLEGWQPLRADECTALELPEASLGWVREVYLRGHGEKWVFARSVAARSALLEGGLNLDELGTRSLGELLFSDKAFERGPLQVCRYPEAWLPTADATSGLWARRSRFSRGALSVLVAEVFLPTLWNALKHKEHP
ncbi:putative chorismate pyruvate-lyase [Pseudomonas cichorii]|uniref:Probable chorismate pyruvate-lyase n=1 Tax=Pseudomonas cichorii TaxID=36746 RepID=A0A3M4M2U9_PSECI|nr:chorismate lyase [Pseudomonas cichorii]RMQ48096.1 putative chorismate pyruvate-lyase [Pseudomonas cichorii]